jgi:microcystin-dependent protein
LAEIYVPASGNPTATIYAANNMRLEYMAALVAEVTAARAGQASLSAELATLAPLFSAPLTGTPTAPTAAPGTSTTQLANTAFVAGAIAGLVNSSPAALNTLNELAAALGDDANFAADITALIALKAPLASPSLTGTPTAPTAAPGTSTTQIATTAFASGVIPSGAILPYGGPVAPSGYLACDGSNVSRTVYANLFAAIGSIYGNGDGYSTFTLPNMQGVFPLGKSGGYGIGTTGGAATHTLAVSEIPAHAHNVSHSLNPAGSPVGGAIGGTTPSMDGEVYTDDTGGGGAHNNMPPYLALNFIIKT